MTVLEIAWTFGDLKFTEMSCFTVSTLQCLPNEVLTRWFCMQLSGEHYDSFYGYRLYGSVSFLEFSTDFSICSTCYVNLLVLSGCIIHHFVAYLCCWVVLILLCLWAYVYLDNVLLLWYSPTLPHDQLYSTTLRFFIPTGSPSVGAIVGAILVVVVVLCITAGITAWRYCT